jgi:hypothetical protein
VIPAALEWVARAALTALLARWPGVASSVIGWAAGESARVHGARCGWSGETRRACVRDALTAGENAID